MRAVNLALVLLFLIVVFVEVHAQGTTKTLVLPKTTPTPAPPPGEIRLLPGYVHIKKQGIDTAVGEIRKPGGMVIEYDNGPLAGSYTGRLYQRKKEEISVYQWQIVNGLTLKLARAKNGDTAATFSETCANFITTAPSEQNFSDFLLMIMTYKPPFDPAKMPPKNGNPYGC